MPKCELIQGGWAEAVVYPTSNTNDNYFENLIILLQEIYKEGWIGKFKIEKKYEGCIIVNGIWVFVTKKGMENKEWFEELGLTVHSINKN